jgi:hypothetical protein
MTFSRISARKGSPVALNTRFIRGGQVADPFAIYLVEIYAESEMPENIIDSIVIPSPESSDYPSPLVRGGGTGSPVGLYTLDWTPPNSCNVPGVFFDVWHFFGTDPRLGSGGTDTTGTEPSLDGYIDQLDKICNRFFVYPDDWFGDSGLQTVEFGFEPLSIKFNKPEVRPLEVGIMPLPLYDYDYNLVTPLIPYLTASISIKTENDELVVNSQPMTIKIRQGSFRTNPFNFSYLLDTSRFFIGTYKYRIMVNLPDGTTRVSQNFYITIS